jgi:hypothetical protein
MSSTALHALIAGVLVQAFGMAAAAHADQDIPPPPAGAHASMLSPTAAAQTQAQEPVDARPCLSIGVGYPDLRLRGRIWGPLDAEFKFAFDNVSQAYSGRLYYNYWSWSNLDFDLGMEGGAIRFTGIDGLNGDGSFYEPFLGFAFNAGKIITLSAEIGPAFLNLNADGESLSTVNAVVTTAIYVHLF